MPSVTFLIGNGFDLNLGLKTSYKDFMKEYLKDESDSDAIKEFKEHLDNNPELWSDVELALGKITKHYGSDGNGADVFSECHNDISERLAQYLEKEESKLNHDMLEIVRNAIINLLNNYKSSLRIDRSRMITNALTQYPGPINYYFLIYNYTEIIDNCLKDQNAVNERLNKETIRGKEYNTKVQGIVHVHGTTKGDMIFGVNDESQIDNIEMFNRSNTIYKQQFIKQSCNQNNGNNIDILARDIISNSLMIYMYGISIGDTDALWWKRVCNLMVSNPYAQVIIYKYPVPKRGVNNTAYLIAEDEIRNRIVSFGSIDPSLIESVKNRIHIDENDRLFEASDIANEENPRTREILLKLAQKKAEIQSR